MKETKFSDMDKYEKLGLLYQILEEEYGFNIEDLHNKDFGSITLKFIEICKLRDIDLK